MIRGVHSRDTFMHRAVARVARLLAPHIGADAAVYARWLAEAARKHADPRAELMRMARRVAMDEPLAYVIGTQPFGPLELAARAPVLIPRPETEAWAIRAAKYLTHASQASDVHVLDLCTGSGCIALLTAHELARSRRPWRVTAVDVDPHALQLVRENAQRVGLALVEADGYSYAECGAGQVRIAAGDVFSDADMQRVAALSGAGERHFSVLCNPPYIRPSDYATLDASVREHESRVALVGDSPQPSTDGLAFYRRLARLVPRTLAVRGLFAAEVGAGQARDVASMFPQSEVWPDEWGHDRVVAVRYEAE